jgi:hypothetical protein
MKFSKDGNLFTYMNCENNELQVYDIRDWSIEKLMDKIKASDALMKYTPSEEDVQKYKFEDTVTLKFDLNERYVVLNNSTQLFVININNQTSKCH